MVLPLIRRWLTQQSPTAEALIACISPLLLKPVKRKWLTVYWSSTSRSKRRSLLPEMVEKKAQPRNNAARLEEISDSNTERHIDNDLPLQTLRQRVETLHQQYLTLAKARGTNEIW